MAEVTSKRIFKFTVQGHYYGAHDTTGVAVIKSYSAVFTLLSQEAALSVICKHLLDPYLRKNYPDYAKFRTHALTHTEVVGEKPDLKTLQMPIDEMNQSQLADFCILKQILIDPYKHPDFEKCKAEVKTIWEAMYAQQRYERESGKAKEKQEVDDLLDMNNLLAFKEKPIVNKNEQIISGVIKKEGDKAKATEPLQNEEPALPIDELPPEEGELLL